MAPTVPDAEKSIGKALSEDRISEKDADILRAFIADAQAVNGISENRANLYASSLCRAARFIPTYHGATSAELYACVAGLRSPTARDGSRPYAQNTLQSTITILRIFFRWLVQTGYCDIPVQQIDRIKPPKRDLMTKTAGDMLTPDEVQAIINQCRRSSDRALMWMLYEGGFRIGELIDMTWEQVTFDIHGAVVNVDAKTDRPRYVRLIMAAKPLAAWQADYPFDPDERGAKVFLNHTCRPITYAGVTMQIMRLAKRAGIKKHTTPHIFRHSRITHLIREGVNESVIKLMMWGNINTEMFATYAHLTGSDIDAEMLRTYGIETAPKKRTSRMQPVQCQGCKRIVEPGPKFCPDCGQSLTKEAGATVGKAKSKIASDPEVMKALFEDMFNKKLEEMKEKGEI